MTLPKPPTFQPLQPLTLRTVRVLVSDVLVADAHWHRVERCIRVPQEQLVEDRLCCVGQLAEHVAQPDAAAVGVLPAKPVVQAAWITLTSLVVLFGHRNCEPQVFPECWLIPETAICDMQAGNRDHHTGKDPWVS